MKSTDAKALQIVELIEANQHSLGRIKKGDKSLCFNPLAKGEVVEGIDHFNVKDQAVLLIAQIVEKTTGSISEGLGMLRQAKECFLGYHTDED